MILIAAVGKLLDYAREVHKNCAEADRKKKKRRLHLLFDSEVNKQPPITHIAIILSPSREKKPTRPSKRVRSSFITLPFKILLFYFNLRIKKTTLRKFYILRKVLLFNIDKPSLMAVLTAVERIYAPTTPFYEQIITVKYYTSFERICQEFFAFNSFV